MTEWSSIIRILLKSANVRLSTVFLLKYSFLILLIFTLSNKAGFAEDQRSAAFSDIDFAGQILDLSATEGWIYKRGDDQQWAAPYYDRSEWSVLNPKLYSDDLPEDWNGNGWFSNTVTIDSSLVGEEMAIKGRLYGAMEVYLNGEKIGHAGTVGSNRQTEESAGYFEPISFQWDDDGKHHIAIRYSNHHFERGWHHAPHSGMELKWGQREVVAATYQQQQSEFLQRRVVDLALFGFLIGFAFLHLILYSFYPADRSNLLIGILFLSFAVSVGSNFFIWVTYQPDHLLTHRVIEGIFITLTSILNLAFAYKMINRKPDLPFKLFVIAGGICIGYVFIELFTSRILTTSIAFLSLLFSVSLFIHGRFKKNMPDLNVILFGYLIFLLAVMPRMFWLSLDIEPVLWVENYLILQLGILAVPILYSSYLAKKFSRTNENLIQKLAENRKLARENLEHEKHSRALISRQKEQLEQEVKKRTQELEKAYNELQESHENLKNTQQQLLKQEKMASLGRLTAGIAHEIKNPLNFVNNFSMISVELINSAREELRANESSVKQEIEEILADLEENLQKINEHGDRANNIVTGMLEHTKQQTGKRATVSVNKLLNEITDLAYQGFVANNQADNIEVNKDLDPDIGKHSVFLQDLNRALLNILNNGLQAAYELYETGGTERPELTVSTRKVGDGVEIRVRDNGSGIPDEIKERIFEPFFTTRSAGQGTGLGLSLAFDIIEAHGGELKVDSKTGEGTEFITWLPN